jgi:hypothetical protein
MPKPPKPAAIVIGAWFRYNRMKKPGFLSGAPRGNRINRPMGRFRFHLYRVVATVVILTLTWALVLAGEQERVPVQGSDLTVQRVSVEQSTSQSREPSVFRHLFEPLRGWLSSWVLDAEAIKLYAKWVVGAPLLVVCIIVTMMMFPRRKPTPIGPVEARSAIADTIPVTARARKPSRIDTATPASKSSDHQKILIFFLQLFKRQQGLDADAESQIYLVETRSACPNEIYEMRILHNEEWITRRMSIGLLGQGGGSRSKCFYIIYDTHMVVKIPPARMTRFGDYKRQIAAEARIVSQLAPRLCIVPRVSVIMKAVHPIAQSDHLSEDALESRYMGLLQENPELQEHLKIDGSFAFFMDLAKHFFLNTILEEIHQGYGRLIDEAREHPDLLWDPHGFVCRYGEQAASVRHALQEIHSGCEGRLRQVVTQAGITSEVPAYHLRQWFLTHLVGESVEAKDCGLPEAAIEKVNQLLGEVVREHAPLVERYRGHLVQYVGETRFSRYRRQVEALAANILELLAWIGQKAVVMRDLKPENLFVAGNPEEYPTFMNDSRKFSIGLIDVETSLVIDAEDPILIAQPQLAGTPLYATPAHLIPNSVLLQVYDDIEHILHLQDWHATIAMIGKLVTGEHVFSTTAHVFPDILNRLKSLDQGGPARVDEIIRIQRLFWNSAVAEFQDYMSRHAEVFARLDIMVPAVFVGEIASHLRTDIAEMKQAVARAAGDQSFFNSGEKRRYLEEASAHKIGQMRTRLAQDEELPKDPILLYFELFERLKTRLEHKQRALATISAPRAEISADHLLETMFERVLTAMYPSHWPALAPEKYGRRTLLDPDIATYQATL